MTKSKGYMLRESHRALNFPTYCVHVTCLHLDVSVDCQWFQVTPGCELVYGQQSFGRRQEITWEESNPDTAKAQMKISATGRQIIIRNSVWGSNMPAKLYTFWFSFRNLPRSGTMLVARKRCTKEKAWISWRKKLTWPAWFYYACLFKKGVFEIKMLHGIII